MPDTSTVTTTLINQLRAMAQLTQTEAQIARVRVAQARTDAVRTELRQNGDNAEARTQRIVRELHSLGGVPDVVTPALGRVLAFVKSTVEQAQPLDEALLGDLTLEHQLLDRARYVKVLAQRAERTATERLADDLVTAHTATVEWLTTVLAEEALGGPAALRPTPLQRVTGTVGFMVSLPTRFAVERVNRAVHTVYRAGEGAREGAEEMAERVARIGKGTREAVTAGRDATLSRAEEVARRDGERDTADAVHTTRRNLGTLDADELPIEGYDDMTAQNAIAAVRELDEADDINAILAYEENNKNRAGVVSATQARIAAVAKDAAGV